jgi:hypothetical protein
MFPDGAGLLVLVATDSNKKRLVEEGRRIAAGLLERLAKQGRIHVISWYRKGQ